MSGLPTPDQLRRLPLRAVVAYAVRAARRVGPLLKVRSLDESIEQALRFAEKVAQADSIEIDEVPRTLLAMAEITGSAISEEPSRERRLAAQCIRSAAWAAHMVVQYSEAEKSQNTSPNPRVTRYAQHAVNAAARAGREVIALGEPDCTRAIQAIIRDYEILVEMAPEEAEIRLGNAIDLTVFADN